MKQKKRNPHLRVCHTQPKYPNEASNTYVKGKLLDIATAVASGMGLVTAMIFLITLT